jgi:hypothetical protein
LLPCTTSARASSKLPPARAKSVVTLPPDPKVGQGEGLGIGAALERDLGGAAHGASGAVAADHIAGAYLLGPPVSMAKNTGHGDGVGTEADQLHTPLDQDPTAGQMVAEDLFGLGLGDQQQERIGAVVQAETKQPDADDAAAGMELDPDRVVAPPDQLVGQPQPAQDLQGARLDTQRARLLHPVQLPVDDANRRPQRPQLGGQGEAGRPGPDHQNVEQLTAGRRHDRPGGGGSRRRW